jgi:hypothetical protein
MASRDATCERLVVAVGEKMPSRHNEKLRKCLHGCRQSISEFWLYADQASGRRGGDNDAGADQFLVERALPFVGDAGRAGGSFGCQPHGEEAVRPPHGFAPAVDKIAHGYLWSDSFHRRSL